VAASIASVADSGLKLMIKPNIISDLEQRMRAYDERDASGRKVKRWSVCVCVCVRESE